MVWLRLDCVNFKSGKSAKVVWVGVGLSVIHKFNSKSPPPHSKEIFIKKVNVVIIQVND